MLFVDVLELAELEFVLFGDLASSLGCLFEELVVLVLEVVLGPRVSFGAHV